MHTYLRLNILLCGLVMLFLAACAPPTTVPASLTATVSAEVTASNAGEEGEVLGCADGGAGVFTPEDVRCYLDSFDPEFVREIDGETAVLFTDPSSLAEWIGGAIIYHIPTVSTLVLDTEGKIDPQFSQINNRAAQIAFDRLTENTSLMADIQQRVQALWQTGPGETTAQLRPALVYNGRSHGCGDIFLYQANDDDLLSEFLTLFIPARSFALSEEPLTLELADYHEEISVKIDLFGDRVYNFGEFPYCNDVGPEAQPPSVWLAQSGTLTISINGTVPPDSCLGDGYQATIRLENVVFANGEETVQLDEARFENVDVGWCAG